MEEALHKPTFSPSPLALFFIPCSQAAKTTKTGLQIYISWSHFLFPPLHSFITEGKQLCSHDLGGKKRSGWRGRERLENGDCCSLPAICAPSPNVFPVQYYSHGVGHSTWRSRHERWSNSWTRSSEGNFLEWALNSYQSTHYTTDFQGKERVCSERLISKWLHQHGKTVGMREKHWKFPCILSSLGQLVLQGVQMTLKVSIPSRFHAQTYSWTYSHPCWRSWLRVALVTGVKNRDGHIQS